MASFIAKALDKIVGNKEFRILFMGLDAAGKTSILYMLKLGELVTTIPTIGFNVETVEYKNMSFTIWDVGGKDKIRPLWRHYYQNTQCIVFIIDSSDRERMLPPDDSGDDYGEYAYNSAKGLLSTLLHEEELQDAIYLFYANKQDLPNAMSVDEITQKMDLENLMGNTPWFMQTACAKTGEGLYEGLEWMANTLGNIKQIKKEREIIRLNKTKSILLISGYIRNIDMQYIPLGITKLIHWFYQDPNQYFDDKYKFYGQYQIVNDEQLLEGVTAERPELLIRFIQRRHTAKNNKRDSYIADDDEFIDSIDKLGKLLTFAMKEYEWINHYDFIRMIWILFAKHGRRDGFKLIWKYTPYNTTNTYFWGQLIYFAMNNSSNSDTLKLLHSDFEYLLIMNPFLCTNYKELINEYYSKDLLKVIDNEKKDDMVLPDLKQLPSIITDINKLKTDKKGDEYKYDMNDNINNDKDDDNLFIESFEKRSFKSWNGHESFLRVIWCYVDRCDGRKGCVSKIREEWKAFRKDNYHETIMYFWVHMVRYWRVTYKQYVEKNKNNNNIKWNFNGFIEFCSNVNSKKCKMLNDEWWTEFYDENVMFNKGFNDMDASKQMVLPNKKQFPQLKLVTK